MALKYNKEYTGNQLITMLMKEHKIEGFVKKEMVLSEESGDVADVSISIIKYRQ